MNTKLIIKNMIHMYSALTTEPLYALLLQHYNISFALSWRSQSSKAFSICGQQAKQKLETGLQLLASASSTGYSSGTFFACSFYFGRDIFFAIVLQLHQKKMLNLTFFYCKILGLFFAIKLLTLFGSHSPSPIF